MNADKTEWPFDQPRNCAIISLRRIVFDGASILYVSHDEDDGGWQFLDGGMFDIAQAAVVSLEEIVELDPSVLTLADLPLGWCATRHSASHAWKRRPRSQS